MTVQELIRALQAAGWQVVKSDDELHQLKHEDRIVTIAGKLELSLPPGVEYVLARHAQLGGD